MRKTFHPWGDATCKEILVNAKAGMTDQSVLLIDEIVYFERDATAQGAGPDGSRGVDMCGYVNRNSFAAFGTLEPVYISMLQHTGSVYISQP